MPMFDRYMCGYFGAERGAYSVVTDREATGDKSVTVDSDEKAVLEGRYPLSGFTRRGGAAPDGKPEDWTMVVHAPSGHTSTNQIVVVYPKRQGNELRLYFSRSSQFYPTATDIWFIFSRRGEACPHVGFMSTADWNNLFSTAMSASALNFRAGVNIDDEDDFYQNQIGAVAASIPVSRTGMTYPRDPRLGLSAARAAHYCCEIDNSHRTFISAATGNPFVEGHHLIPISSQNEFVNGLDVADNIVALCPVCHRTLHHGQPTAKAVLLRHLFEARHERLALRGLEISFTDILRIYGA